MSLTFIKEVERIETPPHRCAGAPSSEGSLNLSPLCKGENKGIATLFCLPIKGVEVAVRKVA